MLFIGTPIYDNRVTIQYAHGMLQTIALLQSKGMAVQYAFEQGTYLAINREKLIRRFLETDCQFFLFIDADTEFTPLDVLGLLMANVDVVSAMYRYRVPVKIGEPEHCFRLLDETPVDTSQTAPDLQECWFLPTGMLMIRREVIEMLYKEYTYLFNQGFSFHVGFEHSRLQKDPLLAAFEGEDIHFSRIWRELGGKLYVKASIRVGHVGERVYKVTP